MTTHENDLIKNSLIYKTMVDVLNSVLIKHDTNFKSLTKIALSQVILKIIYENTKQGIMIKAIRSKIDEYTGTTFSIAKNGQIDHLTPD